ncbi:MAG: BlaI/MecI/CopY family transcriptional regulator [Lachnospiraceae bacterium]|nr:BlaI/MecI/CopY family transcriptional regulator [Lachnospiraceae bacterium]
MKKLSEAELEIMHILWSHKNSLTSNQILNELSETRNWKLASVMTVLARMAEKGAVNCDRSTRTNFYSALVSEQEYKLAESETFLERLYDKSAKNLIACLYQGKRMSKENIQELREYLDSLEEKQ